MLTRAQDERQPYLDTLRELVSIESGSADVEGLNRIADLLAGRLRTLGGEVEFVDPPTGMVRFENTPARTGKSVVGRFRGTGTKRILLLAHMDTVYQRGMLAKQPFRIDGDRAYGLGIADAKHGVALVLHTVATLKALGFSDYGLVTVLFNGDEETSSAGSRTLITKLGSEHDLVLSFEGAGLEDAIRLTTAGIAAVQLKVTGRASHAGGAPEQGRNAVYELGTPDAADTRSVERSDRCEDELDARQRRQREKRHPRRGPGHGRRSRDARVRLRRIEKQVRERIRKQLIPDTKVEMVFERTRPPLEATARGSCRGRPCPADLQGGRA